VITKQRSKAVLQFTIIVNGKVDEPMWWSKTRKRNALIEIGVLYSTCGKITN